MSRRVCAEGCFRIVSDSTVSVGVVCGPTWLEVVGFAVAGVRCQTVEVAIVTPCIASSVSIFVDPVFSGCDGYREANVVCVWYVCVFQGPIGPIVWACSTLVSSAYHRDRKECRVLNATEVTVTFWWPPWGVDRLHVRHV
ncbi:hypothetical protein Taro_029901 [Colocasia esculenta]|uniref:Uncharacterized protein n=1 Tax=Colocasia esculenta TaxID=4460 RepID=A0A843W1N5_COLES|nr:hypothetical protein [Colocasia esculenta]